MTTQPTIPVKQPQRHQISAVEVVVALLVLIALVVGFQWVLTYTQPVAAPPAEVSLSTNPEAVFANWDTMLAAQAGETPLARENPELNAAFRFRQQAATQLVDFLEQNPEVALSWR